MAYLERYKRQEKISRFLLVGKKTDMLLSHPTLLGPKKYKQKNREREMQHDGYRDMLRLIFYAKYQYIYPQRDLNVIGNNRIINATHPYPLLQESMYIQLAVLDPMLVVMIFHQSTH